MGEIIGNCKTEIVDNVSELNPDGYCSEEDYLSEHIQKNTQMAFEEFIAECKDDRMTTKKVISADVASRCKVQNQNDRVIADCERELRKPGLSEDYRRELMNRINECRKSTESVDKESREFERQELQHLHKLPAALAGSAGGVVIVLLVIKCVGKVA